MKWQQVSINKLPVKSVLNFEEIKYKFCYPEDAQKIHAG
jgi:hypothetical protein